MAKKQDNYSKFHQDIITAVDNLAKKHKISLEDSHKEAFAILGFVFGMMDGPEELSYFCKAMVKDVQDTKNKEKRSKRK